MRLKLSSYAEFSLHAQALNRKGSVPLSGMPRDGVLALFTTAFATEEAAQ